MRFHFVNRAENEDNMTPHETWAEIHGIPLVQKQPSHSCKLAIVGGGPSVQSKLSKLRKWSGDVWAINATTSYLTLKGIKNTLFSVDAATLTPEDYEAHKGAENAVLAACCDPKLFEYYAGRVRTFYTRPNHRAPFIAEGGTSSATRLPLVAKTLGYEDITFFGCEGSYKDESHVNLNKASERRLFILAGGIRYCTEPALMVQAQWLADLIKNCPEHCHEESGGLLRSMILYPDWTVLGVSDAMKTYLEESRDNHQRKLQLKQPIFEGVRA